MKIPRKLIVKVALNMLNEKGEITQFDVHSAIEEILHRELTVGEKIRVTRIILDEFYPNDIKREGIYGIRVYYFRR